MNGWMKRIRASIGIGFAWGIAGMLVGGFLELIDNVLPGALPFISRVDMWPQTLAIPGFLGGIIFSIVLAIAARKHRFSELSLSRFTLWGTAAGALLGGWAMSNGAPGYFLAITTLSSAVLAPGSLALARLAERRERLGGGAGQGLLERTD